MVEKFFFMSELRTEFQISNRISLLAGPPSSGKTSLLFQWAFNSAVGNNGAVVVLCNRRRLEANPPVLSQGVDPSSETFARIQMKYIDDDEGIKNYFAALHLHDTFPVSVIVDDFADFFDESICQKRYNNPRGRDLAMVRTLAICRNAIDHANEKGSCELLLSDTYRGGDSPRLLYIYKRWVSCIYRIQDDGSRSSFILTETHSDITRTAKYSIALQYLMS